MASQRRFRPQRLVLAALLGFVAGPGLAQWPAKPVRVIVPFAPGGGADLTARPVAQKLYEALGQQFVVDNRGGAAGAIGMEMAAKATPDGYTVMIMSASYSATPATHKLKFDPQKEILPVVEISNSPHVIVVHPSVPVKSTQELIEYARARPGEINYASSGLGGFTHLGTELFASMTRTKMVHVPYKSTGAAMGDMLSGQCKLMVGSLLGTQQHFQSNRLRAVAMTSDKRWPSLPNLPTVAETVPGYTLYVWYGLFAPRGTPAPIVQTLNATVNKLLESPDLRKILDVQGMSPAGGPPSRLGDLARRDYERWVKVVKEAGIKID